MAIRLARFLLFGDKERSPEPPAAGETGVVAHPEPEDRFAPPDPGFKVQLFRRLLAEESLVRLDVVEELARALCATLDVDRILSLLSQQLPKLVDHSHLCLALRSEERDGYVIEHSVAQEGFTPVPVGTVVPDARFGLHSAAEFAQPVYHNDLALLTHEEDAPWRQAGICSRLAVPLVVETDCLGLLILASHEPAAFVPEEVEFLESITRYLAIALRNAMLYQQSQDALAELQATQHQLIQVEKQREIGEMAAGIAHDLNNSLCGIVGLAELAELQTTDPTLIDLLTKLRDTTMETAATVRRINLFGRQKAGPEDTVETDLQDLAEGTLTLTRYRWRNMAQMEGRSIEMKTQFDHPAPVFGKPNELREVLTNLIMNAVDAMPEGGAVTVRTFCADGQACLSVSDTGVGIPKEQQERVFDRHYTTKGEGGSGVGLSISREIARAHGGDLTVSSVPGEGAVFTLRLPLHEPQRSRGGQQPGVSNSEPTGASLRVLLVEDDRKVRDILALFLQRSGHRVTCAGSAREGLERFRQSSFDLVLTDLGLPDGTGEDVVRGVRDHSPGTPLILVTGWQGTLDETRVREWGAAEILYKPVSGEDLRKAVADLCGRNGGPSA